MHIEFVADTSALGQDGSGSRVFADTLSRFATEAEASGFDRVRVVARPDGHDVTGLASYILHTTSRLGVLAEHDAGLVAPEVAARQIATLDRLSCGRLAIAVVAGDGGNHGHEERLERLDEYLVLLKRLWSNEKAFDHEGKFFRSIGAFAPAKPHGDRRVPISMGGLSGTAIKVAARHADLFALPASTVAATRVLAERVCAASACYGRADAIRFSYPLRAVIAPTTAQAWARAGEPSRMAGRPEDATLVAGTPERVASVILDYSATGISISSSMVSLRRKRQHCSAARSFRWFGMHRGSMQKRACRPCGRLWSTCRGDVPASEAGAPSRSCLLTQRGCVSRRAG